MIWTRESSCYFVGKEFLWVVFVSRSAQVGHLMSRFAILSKITL
jgi:hypothetical protein